MHPLTDRNANDHRSEWLVQQITGVQPRLFAMIVTLAPDVESARDVLQETNLVLWRKADEFDAEGDFTAWAIGVARMQVRAHMKRRGRDRLVIGEAAAQLLAQAASEGAHEFDARHGALRACVSELNAVHRQMVEDRYAPGGSVARIAQGLGRTAASVSTTLLRIRRQLADCIDRRLARERSG